MNRLKYTLAGVLMLASGIVQAQVYSTVNSASTRGINAKKSGIEFVGDPYLHKGFVKAHVRFANSNTGLFEVRYDQLSDELITKGPDGSEMAFGDRVLEFKFQDSKEVFRNGFPPVGKATEASYYQVVFDGKTKYLKRNLKTLIDTRELNGPVIKKVENDVSYFIMKPNEKPELVKNNDKAILGVLSNSALNTYAKEQKLNLKNEGDVSKLLAYADSL